MNKRQTTHFSKDMYLFMDFINRNDSLDTFLHCTSSENLAKKILHEGLIFESHLTHTSDQVSGVDIVELNYFRLIRKFYGNYTIIIQISEKLVVDFSKRLQNTPYHFSEALSITRPAYLPDESPRYILPAQFIRGYFDHIQNRGIDNPLFDPFFFPLYFEDNLQRLLTTYQS